MYQMHECTLSENTLDESSINFPLTCCQKFVRKLQNAFLISPKNPQCGKYFRSENAIKSERQRQLEKFPCVIHPLSAFRCWYDVYLCMLYFCSLMKKPVDSGFAVNGREIFEWYNEFSLTIDILCFIDVIITFFSGYVDSKLREVELSPKKIVRSYCLSPHLICDILSSVPCIFPFWIWDEPSLPLVGVMVVISLTRIVRLRTFVELIYKAAQVVRINSPQTVFIVSSSVVVFIIIHWMACLQFIVPHVAEHYFSSGTGYKRSWIFTSNVFDKPFLRVYCHGFLRSSTYILGIRKADLYTLRLTVELILAILTYLLGKIVMGFVWICLAMHFLNRHSMQIKYNEIVNQVEEYMIQKKIPKDLRKRLLNYYKFKYQKIYFREDMVSKILPQNLRNDIYMHICRNIIKNIEIFSPLSPDEISKIVSQLKPLIFLPQDTIMQSGLPIEGMFFISSGTVALYTHSGKELCHVGDGSYFGEIALILKRHGRSLTAIAVETTKVYLLETKVFENVLMKNEQVKENLTIKAKRRYLVARQKESEYKDLMFGKNYSHLVIS